MDIRSFQGFCVEQFPFLGPHLTRLRDGRKRPLISVVSIFWSLFYGGVLGLGSLLGIDQFLRTKAGKRLFGTKKPVVCDTTLSQSLSTMTMAPLRDLLQKIYARAPTIGPSRLPVGIDHLRVGMIDGTSFGRLRASCFAQIGTICLMADLEPYEKQGKELPASERLLNRLAKHFGYGFVDLVLLDGLYMAKGFIKCALSNGIDVLIKTEEERLDIIQDAKALMRAENARDFGVQIIEGIDHKRLRTYQIRVVEGLFYMDVDAPFKVAYVHEQEIKTGKRHDFYVLTTMVRLTPNQMRELAHQRWNEENNGFKALNHLVHTKHIYAHEQRAQQAMMFILMIAGNLLQLFEAGIPDQALQSLLGNVKRTKRLIQQLIRQSIMQLPEPDT